MKNKLHVQNIPISVVENHCFIQTFLKKIKCASFLLKIKEDFNIDD
jgi:hypothetical protein